MALCECQWIFIYIYSKCIFLIQIKWLSIYLHNFIFLAMAKSYKIVYYRPVYENLVSELREMWPRGEVSEEEDQIIGSALTQLNYVVQGSLLLFLNYYIFFSF
uniref:Odorant receptor n=1 Tax=Leucinodes orbonalis TaxID=711050 RepID=A0AAU0QJZ7_9NEOP|nr:odorant receptor [Leucinodes orbonalis]